MPEPREQNEHTHLRVTITIDVSTGTESTDNVRGALTRSFDVFGPSTGIELVSIDAVEAVTDHAPSFAVQQPVDRFGRTFFDHAEVETLIREQGLKPVHDLDELAGNFWPDDEGPDEFDTWLRALRRQE